MNINRVMARRWQDRWLELSERSLPVIKRLQDSERSGANAKFSIKLVNLFALVCSQPEDYGRPISHWTGRELADEMVKQGIVERISPRHVVRLLEEAQIKPHSYSVLVDTLNSMKNLMPKSTTLLIYI